MNLKAKFLTLSMKDQICITIMVLELFCTIVLLSICGSLAYEILHEDFNQKKLYFYEKYKEYIESCFYFHNLCFLQYEEILKRTQRQMWDHMQVSSKYKFISNFKNMANKKVIKIEIDSYYPINDTLLNQINDDDLLFYTCFDNSESSLNQCSSMENIISKQYSSLSSLIASHNIHDSFRIPLYDTPIFDAPIVFNINKFIMYSFDSSKMIDKIHQICGNEFNIAKIYNYFEYRQNNIIDYVKNKIKFFFENRHPLISHIFEKIIKDITAKYHLSNALKYISYDDLAHSMTGFFTVIDYSNDNIFLINSLDEYYFYYYIESNIIKDYLYFMNNKISAYIDVYLIPLHIQNDTIINQDLCFLFMLKQLEYYDSRNKFDELYQKLIKGKSKIEDCFVDQDILNSQPEIKDVFNLNFNDFLLISNYIIYEGIVNLRNTPYYYIKFTTPNYNSLKHFKTDYFILDQMNYYLFFSFKEPLKYTNLVNQISSNCFYTIILCFVYNWAICILVNLIIFYKIIKRLTEPFKKLLEAVQTSSIKDENTFIYEYDDIINELFITCKELITGKIDKSNNEKGLNNFKILSLPKDSQNDIEENRYVKNLIINNDLMNQLIIQQQTMMDFSKNIQINDFNTDNNEGKKNASSNQIMNLNINNCLNLGRNSIKINTINNKKLITNEVKEIEDKQPYQKLFQISQYLYYYQNKTDNNYIQINDNTIIEKDESRMSKFSKKYEKKNSFKINEKFFKSIKRGDSKIYEDSYKSISINMINNQSLSYLWYM
jgi:hypothetical protein